MGLFRKIAFGGWSLVVGASITVRELGRTVFRRKAVTLQYPHEKPELSPNFRSAIKLIKFDETNSHDCVACLACQRICPSFCIDIEGGRVDGIKKKRASKFDMDFALCSLCGLCIDVCPTTTLEYSKIYDSAGYNRDWNFDLLEEFKGYEERFVAEQKVREEKEAEEKKKKAAAKKAAAAKAKAAKEAKAKAKEAEPAKEEPDKADKAEQADKAEPKKTEEPEAKDGDA